MTRRPDNHRSLRRLQITLSVAWSLAWILGTVSLAALAASLYQRWSDSELDGQLELVATAVYGLTWFDERGRLHDEVFLQEQDLVEGAYGIWIVRPGDPPHVEMRSGSLEFEIDDLGFIATEVVQQDAERFVDGVDRRQRPYRLHAVPTYDERGFQPIAAVIVAADPGPVQDARRSFIGALSVATLLLGGGGIVVGILLARWSLKPVVASLEQREHFLAAAAHELRTPVAALRGVLESGEAGDEAAQDALHRATHLVRQTAHTLDDLLLHARLDMGHAELKHEKVRLDLLVESCLPEESGVVVETDECVVEADPRLLRVVVRNLVENARQHGEGGIEIRVHSNSVTVEDRGPGFPPGVLDATTTGEWFVPSTGGTGLGLAVSRRIAELHGGTLSLENRTDGGARARLQLPAAVS